MLDSLVVSGIIISGTLGDAGVEDGNELDVHVVEEVRDVLSEVAEIDGVHRKVTVPIHIIDISPLCVQWDTMGTIVVDNVSIVFLCPQAVLRLVPSKGPLRGKYWLANDVSLVHAHDGVGTLSIEHDVDISEAARSNLVDVYEAFPWGVTDGPVLGLGLLEEDTDPMLFSVLVHEEGVNTITLLTGWNALVLLGRLICGPHRVQTVFVKEVLRRALAQPHDAAETVVLEGHSLEADPIEVGVVDHVLQQEEGLCLLHSHLSEIKLEWGSLDGHMAS